jgi:alkanesulfonate monooxygenase SsuD/methylene tetrahydromethanopterin reductase-like flavin-dependent oxidoreductase (luciferase family)
VNEPDHPDMTMFEASITLAAMALNTSRIRDGTLVTSMYLRNPVMMASATYDFSHPSNLSVNHPVSP